ncbi:MAG: Nif3-like dinuclear metal center hexameric protein [Mycoplasma sp.]
MKSLSNLYQYLTQLYPLKYQEKWDQSGLKVFGNKKDNIDKVLISLDINYGAINFAIKNKIKLIIAHHPIFTDSEEIKTSFNDLQNIKLLKKHKINIIGLHTNIDNNPKGLNYYLVNKLPIKKALQKKHQEGTYFEVNLNKNHDQKSLKMLLKNTYQVNCVNSITFSNKINKLLFCSGSGFNVLSPTFKNISNNTAIVTGDIKWHNWQMVNDLKINTFDVGHDVEKWFIELITKKLLAFDSSLKLFSYYPDLKLDIYK